MASSSADAGIDRRLTLIACGCSVAAGLGLLYLSLGRAGDWVTTWLPLGTGICLTLASVSAGGLVLRTKRRRRSPPQQNRLPSPEVHFANPEVWREIDTNRDLLYALLELSRRRMLAAASGSSDAASRVKSGDSRSAGT
ncbi:hypothetical protein FCE95_08965 [Luteimonas gilva]|uniref:Uncharacterized protein n=1 Tax=Luteimonas gilva TaxID=2572684 RepID=A0A4U5JPE0_9GAMM|nr:hypothetical protein [Luteimonas gilva]TKR30258.1 hypothetical protein FCE95_08965 [Luteimonas gilva]